MPACVLLHWSNSKICLCHFCFLPSYLWFCFPQYYLSHLELLQKLALSSSYFNYQDLLVSLLILYLSQSAGTIFLFFSVQVIFSYIIHFFVNFYECLRVLFSLHAVVVFLCVYLLEVSQSLRFNFFVWLRFLVHCLVNIKIYFYKVLNILFCYVEVTFSIHLPSYWYLFLRNIPNFISPIYVSYCLN